MHKEWCHDKIDEAVGDAGQGSRAHTVAQRDDDDGKRVQADRAPVDEVRQLDPEEAENGRQGNGDGELSQQGRIES